MYAVVSAGYFKGCAAYCYIGIGVNRVVGGINIEAAAHKSYVAVRLDALCAFVGACSGAAAVTGQDAELTAFGQDISARGHSVAGAGYIKAAARGKNEAERGIVGVFGVYAVLAGAEVKASACNPYAVVCR